MHPDAAHRSPPPATDRRRPSKGWYLLAVVPVAVAAIFAIGYWLVNMQRFDETVDGFHRFTSPGELTQAYDHGSVHIYAEMDTSQPGSTGTAASPPRVEVFSPTGSPVALMPYMNFDGANPGWTYDIGGHRGLGLVAFDVGQPGEYRIVATGGEGLVLAVGDGIGQQREKITFNAVGYTFLGGPMGGVVIVFIALMRRRSGRRARS